MFKKSKSVDSFCQKTEIKRDVDWPLAKFVQKHKSNPILFSKFGRVSRFSTESLYFHFIKSEKQPDFRSLDGFLRFEKKLPITYAIRNRKHIRSFIHEKYGNLSSYFKSVSKMSLGQMSMVKLWNVSIVAALIFGMFIMTFIYRYLGQEAAAVTSQASPGKAVSSEVNPEQLGRVLGESVELIENKNNGVEEMTDYIAKIMTNYEKESEDKKKIKEEIREMVQGYPIEKMIPYIVEQDPLVAAFLVGIAKKESDWGKHVPVLDGEDCYNYWGYRGKRTKMGSGGHTCFDSREDAVKTVAKRIKFLASDEKRNTPQKMTVWKCGFDCSWDNPAAVKKWATDVDHYFKKFDKFVK